MMSLLVGQEKTEGKEGEEMKKCSHGGRVTAKDEMGRGMR